MRASEIGIIKGLSVGRKAGNNGQLYLPLEICFISVGGERKTIREGRQPDSVAYIKGYL